MNSMQKKSCDWFKSYGDIMGGKKNSGFCIRVENSPYVVYATKDLVNPNHQILSGECLYILESIFTIEWLLEKGPPLRPEDRIGIFKKIYIYL